MDPDNFRSGYVSRPAEEEAIKAAARHVRETRDSHALLIYGPGGMGKTSLVRRMARAHARDPGIAWLDPVDVDDPEYWLLATLERKVARELDPDGEYFGPYLRYLSRLPAYTSPRVDRDLVISHLGRIKKVFVECYKDYIAATGVVVVMTFDTVEAMRGNYLLYTFTQWMKSLPGTLFILSGRPTVAAGDRLDPIRDELEDVHQNITVAMLTLGPFSYEATLEYLGASAIGGALEPPELEKLALLTQGHPLWLAFAVSYVRERSMPPEAAGEIDEIRQAMPFSAELTREGQQLQVAFKRSMMAPYQAVDFWPEAIKRLAVVRQGMSQPIWNELMSDMPLPPEAETADDAWRILRQTPWVRSRANGREVTLHDAVAEELAQHIIPLHHGDLRWRRGLWQRAARIYQEMTEGSLAGLAEERARVDGLFDRLPHETKPNTGEFPLPDLSQPSTTVPVTGEAELIAEVVRLESRIRELDQLRVSAFHYQLLSDCAAGANRFLELFSEAKRDYDVFLQDRLALEMQRFLPGTSDPYPLTDVISSVVEEIAEWLAGDGRESYLKIGMAVGGYLIDNQHPKTALSLLDRLPDEVASSLQRSQLEILKANANMRMPLGVPDAFACLDRALQAAANVPEAARRQSAIADVYKEMGFCFRNAGRWKEADNAYEQARDAIIENLAARESDSDHEDMASIQTQWAYVKGLTGDYRDGVALVDRAIATRHRLGLHAQEGLSLSSRGEIFRYERRFQKAWASFEAAEQIFQGNRDWSWLGLIYQEQAICLLQAMEDGVNLVPGKDPADQAKRLIRFALDICRDQNIRAYPSALNRAGRIFGAEDVMEGLEYLDAAAFEARGLSDGWFWSASLIEYAELAYRAWVETGDANFRAAISGKADQIRQSGNEFHFADLEGRWLIVSANLAMRDWIASADGAVPDVTLLDAVMHDYAEGFRLLAQGQFGSSGAALIPSRFSHFSSLFASLPEDEKRKRLRELLRLWRNIGDGSTILLACVEQLY
jgi:tetratricopeptide (TPR) repeat protein